MHGYSYTLHRRVKGKNWSKVAEIVKEKGRFSPTLHLASAGREPENDYLPSNAIQYIGVISEHSCQAPLYLRITTL
jgi:hypothetical protein